jgi:hypothetical protein
MTAFEFDQMQNNLQLALDDIQRLTARVTELEKQIIEVLKGTKQ